MMFAWLLLISNALVAQHRHTINTSKSPEISLAEFNKRIERITLLLKTKNVKDISDADHINIMMCSNTIKFEYNNPCLVVAARRYWLVLILLDKLKYSQELRTKYPKNDWSRGGGLYVDKLNMEIDGLPGDYAIFKVLI